MSGDRSQHAMMARLLCAVLYSLAIVHAQTSRGTVTGAITDPSGAAAGRAQVELTQLSTRARREAMTNASGVYQFEAVDPGVYELKVVRAGFRSVIDRRLEVKANRTAVMDIQLELGSETTSVQVVANAEIVTRDGPLRGGNFTTFEVITLPLPDPNPLSLAGTLPGVIRPSGTTALEGGGAGVQFSVNGQRVRGNNFLIDGTDNNDIEFTGVAQPFNIVDAVEEVAVQTSNFSAEFGRAAGGVLNVITKSGTNQFHGTGLWRYQSERFDSIDNLSRLEGIPQSVFVHNIDGFTLGGPIIRNRTFFFAAFQDDSNRSTTNYSLVVPTAAAVTMLLQLFPSNPRLTLYLNALGSLHGTGAPFTEMLGPSPQTGIDRGNVQFANAPYPLATSIGGPEWLGRVDHNFSERNHVSARYTRDSNLTTPMTVYFPGFITDSGERNQNFLLSDAYTFGPSYTNEFRFSYAHLHSDQASISANSIGEAQTLPKLDIKNVAAPGVPSGLPFRDARNFLVQETQTKLIGRHTLRYGVELLRQLATQAPSGSPRAEIEFDNSTGYSSFVNFLEDFSGQTGRIRLTIGDSVFHPNVLRQSYFIQDMWKATASLTLTLGLRYEHFGQPLNALKYSAFAGFDATKFFVPSRVNTDNKDLGPAFGLAWSPAGSGWLAKLFGNRKMVWRGGYQINYEPLYTQALALDLSVSSPNAISIDTRAQTTSGRGDSSWFEEALSIAPSAPSISNPQYGTFEKNFRNPYTEHYSFGFERQIGIATLVDVSYVGSESHHLTTRADENPLLPTGFRLYPAFGDRTVRTSQGNSDYNALQARFERRLVRGFQVSASYTWSKSMDSTSEGISQVNDQYGNANLTSIPILQGGLQLDRGLSDFDRRQRLSVVYVYRIPGPSQGMWKQVAGGWSLAGITTLQSGAPYTVLNGFDRNGDGWAEDRPDISNPAAPSNTRAALWPTTGATACASGYRNPDTNTCTVPSAVHWIEGQGFPNGATVGRNTLFTGGTNNFDASLSKQVAIREKAMLELRLDAQNAFNHPQYVNVPPNDVVNSVAGQFLNKSYTDAGIRSFWVQVKLLF